MTIKREDVADLQPGDVVEYHNWDWPNGVTIRGALYTKPPGGLWIGDQHLRMEDGDVRSGDYWKGTLTVVSRAPRPLYVNHPRTEPVPGDIVDFVSRSTGSTIGPFLYTYAERWAGSPDGGRMTRWVGLPGCHPDTGPIYNSRSLRLLVDGETGQVVP